MYKKILANNLLWCSKLQVGPRIRCTNKLITKMARQIVVPFFSVSSILLILWYNQTIQHNMTSNKLCCPSRKSKWSVPIIISLFSSVLFSFRRPICFYSCLFIAEKSWDWLPVGYSTFFFYKFAIFLFLMIFFYYLKIIKVLQTKPSGFICYIYNIHGVRLSCYM